MRNYSKFRIAQLLGICLATITACTDLKDSAAESDTGAEGAEQASDSTALAVEQAEPATAVSVWKSTVSVRVEPGANAKWVTSVSLGERFQYLGESRKVTTDDGERTWAKIQLLDGKEGWILQDFIMIGGQPAAVLKDNTPLYKRPDILTKSDKILGKFDVIGVKGEGAFVEFKGMSAEDTWFTSGWIKSENINTNPVDVASAVYIRKALSLEDEDEQLKELQVIYNSSDFEGSYFLTDLEDMIRELD